MPGVTFPYPAGHSFFWKSGERRRLYPAPGSSHAGDRIWAKPMKALLRSGFLALAIMALAVPANAGPWQDGVKAFQGGDYATALKFWRPLAEHGHAGAQHHLGFMYDRGQGVPKDYAEAVKWHRMAAEQGVGISQFNLGNMYAGGRGVPQDYAEAAKWYRMAAEKGFADAQYNLGFMYHDGLGVPQDDGAAHIWFSLAAAQGDEEAQKYRDIAASRMTSDQIAEAQRMAREWMAKHQQ